MIPNMCGRAIYGIPLLLILIATYCLMRRSAPIAKIWLQMKKHSFSQVLSQSESQSNENMQFSNVLTYVWCSGANKNRWFEFHHFLSIKSVLHFLKPDNILFYYDIYPTEDGMHYNTWLQELRESYPFFLTIGLEASDYGCVDIGKPNISFVMSRLVANRGIYLKEDTILVDDLSQRLLQYDIVTAYNSINSDYDLIAESAEIWPTFNEHTFTKKSLNISCSSPEKYVLGEEALLCVKPKTPIYPKDIWELDDRYGELIRMIFYGESALAKPYPDYTELIPNIAHIIWVEGKKPIDFLFYLTILSLLHVAKVDKLYVHGESPPTGFYWSLVKDHPKIRVVFRRFQGKIFETDVKEVKHMSDILRADILIKYGGIYIDTDAIFVKPLDFEIRGYDAVVTLDIFFSYQHPFPDLFNCGVTLAKKNAKFWHLQLQSMKHYIESDFYYNALQVPYKIKERYPETILIDPHLQALCFQLVCLPSWLGHLEYDKVKHIKPNSFPTWQTSNYAIHWTSPTPNELESHENLLKSGNNTVFANIGMFVLEQSGMLEYFKQSVNNK